jgi:hypothetical protein
MERQAQLPEVIGTAGAMGRLAHLLDRRQEQAQQGGDDAKDDEQFEQGKAAAIFPRSDPHD